MIWSNAVVYGCSTLALLAVFGTVLFLRLRTAQYAIPASLLIAVLCVAQPAYIYAISGFHAALFAISMYAMCAAATAFVRKQDPRRTVLLGGSLAGAQLIHPMCGAAASIALPFALRRSLVTQDVRDTVGAIVSVLFIPALAAIGSLYLLSQNLSILRWPISIRFPQGSILASIEAILGVVPLFAVLTLRSVPSRSIIGVLCLIAAAASSVSAVVVEREYALQSSAAAAALLACLISEWPSDTTRAGLAIGAAVSNCAVAWLLAFQLGA